MGDFVNNCNSLHEYVAFANNDYHKPIAMGKINNQDLHTPQLTDLLIVTHPILSAQAQKAGSISPAKRWIQIIVATTEQVYNEFSSGSPDPTAIRDFVKMFYDRAGSDSTKRPKYHSCLFGDTSFAYKDRIRNNTNLVPAYESIVFIRSIVNLYLRLIFLVIFG
jgi:hypothetical protein